MDPKKIKEILGVTEEQATKAILPDPTNEPSGMCILQIMSERMSHDFFLPILALLSYTQ